MLDKGLKSKQRPEVSTQDYQLIKDYLAQSCGIMLGDNKQYLVQSRLAFLLEKFNLASYAELVDVIMANRMQSKMLKTAVVDAMTTNETFWYRDSAQFTALTETVLPDLLQQKQGTIRIWSAACSSGQEPYTIGICVDKALKVGSHYQNVQIIGTDISDSVITAAKQATYSEQELSRGIDDVIKTEYFIRTGEHYQLKSGVTNRVRFQQFNLLKPFSVLGRFDVIFCRNVLIYFSEEIKRDILTRMADILEPGGYLFLSSTESMPLDLSVFKPVKGISRYYQKIS